MDSKALFSHQESSEMHMILLVWVMDQQLCAASGASVWRRYHFSKSTCSLDVTGVSKYLCVQFFVKTSRCLLLRTERIDQIQQNVTNFPGLVISTSIARKYSLNTCFREIHLSFLSSLSFSSYGNSSQYSRYIFLVIHWQYTSHFCTNSSRLCFPVIRGSNHNCGDNVQYVIVCLSFSKSTKWRSHHFGPCFEWAFPFSKMAFPTPFPSLFLQSAAPHL